MYDRLNWSRLALCDFINADQFLSNEIKIAREVKISQIIYTSLAMFPFHLFI